MKNFVMIVAVIMLSTSFVFAEELRPQSTIDEVTVYSGTARVTRIAKLDLPAGEHTVVFSDMVPEIDDNSLNVSGEGEAKVVLFGANIQTEQLKTSPNEQVRLLEDKIQGLKDDVELKKSFLTVLSQQEAYLNSIRLFSDKQIPEDLVTKMPPPENLLGTLNFLTEQLKGVFENRLATNKEIRALEKEIDVLNRQLEGLRDPQRREQRNIVVDLSAQTKGAFTLKVSYLVGGANWRPVYDARAKLAEDKVVLNGFGLIQQWTGESWDNVKLILSTAQPLRDGRMPYVSPWVLNAQQPIAYQGKSANRMAMMDAGSQYEAFSVTSESADMAAPASAPAEIAYAQSQTKGVSVVYEIAKQATIPSDSTEHRFPLNSQVLDASFEYSIYPKASPVAYLGSRVKNGADNHLLAGQTNLYLDEEFVGKASIDMISPNETFDLYLGVDESVKVERKLVEKKLDETMIVGIPSANKKTAYKYKLIVENFKTKNIKVKLFESTPVAGTDKIKVKIEDVSLKPTVKDWQDRQGVWLWEMDLSPNDKKEISYSYVVEHPKDMIILEME